MTLVLAIRNRPIPRIEDPTNASVDLCRAGRCKAAVHAELVASELVRGHRTSDFKENRLRIPLD